jgi:hypothetical protein
MEVCILTFSAAGDIAGRISDAGGMTGYLIGSLVGPMHADMVLLEGEFGAHHTGRAVEKQPLHTDEVKDLLPRGSSALVLVARPDINDRFVQMFSSWSPEVVRRDIVPETQQRLEAFARRPRRASPSRKRASAESRSSLSRGLRLRLQRRDDRAHVDPRLFRLQQRRRDGRADRFP